MFTFPRQVKQYFGKIQVINSRQTEQLAAVSSQAHAALFINMDFLLLGKKKETSD